MRDPTIEVRALMDRYAEGTHSPPAAAAQIVQYLRENDPQLLTAWLDAQATRILTEAINQRNRSIRAHLRRVKGRVDFSDAIHRHQAGVVGAFDQWLNSPWTVAGVSKPLKEMTAQDLRAAAGAYLERVDGNMKNAKFLMAIERLLDASGAEKVENGVTEGELRRLWHKVDELELDDLGGDPR
jgi:glycine/D-amino acid oxidase-like deaminating enzyme